MKRLYLYPLLLSLLATACKQKKEAAPGEETDLAALKGSTLNILCWEGYAEKAFTNGFEEKYGVTVKGTYFTSSDDLIAKLQNGGGAVYDLVSPSSDVASKLVEGGLIEPLDISKLSAWNDFSPLFKDMKDVQKDGKVYGMPFTWGPDYLVYNADEIKEEPTSWSIFWDPKYKGKVAVWDDISNIYLMGQILGYDKTDASALYNMSDEQLAQVKAKLIALKPQLRKYWVSAGELDEMMKNKEVLLAVGWPITPAALNKAGMNIKSVIPQEGATGWVDRLMIVKGSRNQQLAQLWLDYISQPENMAKVATAIHYSIANPKAAQYMTQEVQELTYVNNMDYYFTRLNFWQPVKDRKKYVETWNEVKGN